MSAGLLIDDSEYGKPHKRLYVHVWTHCSACDVAVLSCLGSMLYIALVDDTKRLFFERSLSLSI